jgi:hypothetical protein
MDRTSLNLISLILGGAGLFAALTGYNVPQTRLSFFGENPYQVKRDEIARVLAWLFTLVALAAGAIQLAAEIAGDSVPARLYTFWSYIRVAAVAVIGAAVVVALVSRLGYVLARRRWLPQVLKGQRERIERTLFAADHNGLAPEHDRERERMRTEELADLEARGWVLLDATLDDLDHLLDLTPLPDRSRRLQRIRDLLSSQRPSA